jgi:hypothetical protein
MNSNTFTAHSILMAMANIALIYAAIDNFEYNTIRAMAIIELVVGPLQFLTAMILFLGKPTTKSWLYVYLILAVILIGALMTLIYSNNNENLQFYLALILIISYLVAHFFLYVVYTVKKV